MTNHHFTGVFLITERRYRRLFSQEETKIRRKKRLAYVECGAEHMRSWKTFLLIYYRFPPFLEKMKRLGLHFISLYFHNNTTVCVCVVCFCLVYVSSFLRRSEWRNGAILFLAPSTIPPNWLHVVYIIYFASPLEISTYCLPFCSSLTNSVCTIPVFCLVCRSGFKDY
jgi:hypothetical protein